VVPAADDDVDLLPRVLPDVAGPQGAGIGVEGEAPGVAQAERPDLAARARGRDEGVVARDRVGAARLLAVDVDPQDLAEQAAEILRALARVVRGAAVADAEVEHPVGAEHGLAAVVVLPGLLDLEEDALARGVGARRRAGADAELGEAGDVALGGRVVEEEAARLPEARMEGDAEQPLLVAARRHRVGEIDELARRARATAAVELEHDDPSPLLGEGVPAPAALERAEPERPLPALLRGERDLDRDVGIGRLRVERAAGGRAREQDEDGREPAEEHGRRRHRRGTATNLGSRTARDHPRPADSVRDREQEPDGAPGHRVERRSSPRRRARGRRRR